ncbi:MAG: arginyltransferase [Thermodesulfobacteriota bacterium]
MNDSPAMPGPRRSGPGLVAELDRCLASSRAACPYRQSHTALYRQARFTRLSPVLFDRFLDWGFRRNGNVLYTMGCPDCTACIPIRLRPPTLQLDRSQRRAWRKNQDLTVEMGPLAIRAESLDLLDRFLASRYPESRAPDYYPHFFLNTITDSIEIRYRLRDRLLAVSIVDCGASALSAVYFFFDPAAGRRSLGTFNILYLADLCRRHALDSLYLGYWIEACQAMAYKARFRPHELRLGDGWQEGILPGSTARPVAHPLVA